MLSTTAWGKATETPKVADDPCWLKILAAVNWCISVQMNHTHIGACFAQINRNVTSVEENEGDLDHIKTLHTLASVEKLEHG
jgi:hypothetical protein